MDLGYVLEIEPIESADGLDLDDERDESKTIQVFLLELGR